MTLRPTHFDASGDWHQMAHPQSAGQQPGAANPAWDGLSNSITQILPSLHCLLHYRPLLTIISTQFWPLAHHGCALPRWLPDLAQPKAAHSSQHFPGKLVDMRTLAWRLSWGPAILELFRITQALRNPGSPLTVLFQSPPRLQENIGSGAPGGIPQGRDSCTAFIGGF